MQFMYTCQRLGNEEVTKCDVKEMSFMQSIIFYASTQLSYYLKIVFTKYGMLLDTPMNGWEHEKISL